MREGRESRYAPGGGSRLGGHISSICIFPRPLSEEGSWMPDCLHHTPSAIGTAIFSFVIWAKGTLQAHISPMSGSCVWLWEACNFQHCRNLETWNSGEKGWELRGRDIGGIVLGGTYGYYGEKIRARMYLVKVWT